MIILKRNIPLSLYAIFLAALSVGYILGHTLPEYEYTIHRQIFADNMTTTSVYLLVVWVYYKRFISHWPANDEDRWWTQVGMIGTASAWALHRAFWAIWRHLLDNGDQAVADWWRDSISAFTGILQISVWAFAVVMVWPAIRRMLGRGLWWAPGVAIPTVWLIWFGLETVF